MNGTFLIITQDYQNFDSGFLLEMLTKGTPSSQA